MAPFGQPMITSDASLLLCKPLKVALQLMCQSAKGKSAAVHCHLHSTHTQPLIPAAGYRASCSPPKGPASMRDMCVSLSLIIPPHHLAKCVPLPPPAVPNKNRSCSFISLSIHSCIFLSALLPPWASFPPLSLTQDGLSNSGCLPQASALSPVYHVEEK